MRTIATGLLVLALAHGGAAAQTAGEQAQILRDFQRNVADYTQRHQCLDLFPEATNAATPAPRIFTLPVAMVFRQLIAKALAERGGVSPASGVDAAEHVAVPPLARRSLGEGGFPAAKLYDFPRVLEDALPVLPEPLEYRLIGHDLVVRDRASDLVVGVLREAVGTALTVRE
jgi:hypothetical protein